MPLAFRLPAPVANRLHPPRLATAAVRIGSALLILGHGLLFAGEAPGLRFESPAQRVTLLELFTSEGCSSCPPAETWLTRMERSPTLWREYVPVAFHVDYWDSDAWRDAWSQSAFSERQRQYAVHGRTENVYTPGFFVNGREWRGWFQGRAALPVDRRAAGTLTLRSGDTNRWQATWAPVGAAGAAPWLHAALLGGGLNSDVGGGENRGRRLRHDFAVLDFRSVPLARSGDGWQATVNLTPTAARRPVESTRALAAWISAGEHGDPIQATGGWLLPPAPAVATGAPANRPTTAPRETNAPTGRPR